MKLRDDDSEEKAWGGSMVRAGKGKDKTIGATDDPSFSTRLALSASGSVKDMMGSSTALDLLHGNLRGSQLARKLPHGSSSRASPHGAHDIPVRSGLQKIVGHSETSHSSFRSSPTQDVKDNEFDEFSKATSLELAEYLKEFDTNEELWPDDNNRISLERDTSLFDSRAQTYNSDGSHLLSLRGESSTRVNQETGGHTGTTQTHPAEQIVYSGDSGDQAARVSDGSAVLNGFSLKRLQMILGHIEEQERLTLCEQTCSTSIESLTRKHLAAFSKDRTLTDNNQPAHEPIVNLRMAVSAKPEALNRASLSTHSTGNQNRCMCEREDRLATHRDEEAAESPFHCPRNGCRHRYNNLDTLRPYPGARWGYMCAHEECPAQFQTHDAWFEHVMRPHHNGL